MMGESVVALHVGPGPPQNIHLTSISSSVSSISSASSSLLHTAASRRTSLPTVSLLPLIISAYHSINDPVIVVEPCGRIVFGNHHAVSLFGRMRMDGCPISKVIPELTNFSQLAFTGNNSSSSLNTGRTVKAKCADGNTCMVGLAVSQLPLEAVSSGDGRGCLVLTLKIVDATAEPARPKTLSRYRQEFDEIACLGRGGFGSVFKALNKLDGQFYAIKKINVSCAKDDSRLLTEVKLFAKLSSHRNIVNYHTAWIEKVDDTVSDDGIATEYESRPGSTVSDEDEENINTASTRNSFATSCTNSTTDSSASPASLTESPASAFAWPTQNEGWMLPSQLQPRFDISSSNPSPRRNKNLKPLVAEATTRPSVKRKVKHNATLFIQMQLCPFKDLRRWLAEREEIDRNENLLIFRQILDGLCHIHSQNIIHRDLKPDNIFIDEENAILLGDFGLAKSIAEHVLLNADVDAGIEASTDQGTYFYQAPEINNRIVTTRSDIYSLGILLFELFHPFETSMERAVILTDLKSRGFFPSRIPADIADLIQNMISADPLSRPSVVEVMQDPIFAVELFSGIGSPLSVSQVPTVVTSQGSNFCHLCAASSSNFGRHRGSDASHHHFHPGTSAPQLGFAENYLNGFLSGSTIRDQPGNLGVSPNSNDSSSGAGNVRSVRRTTSSFTVTPRRRGSMGSGQFFKDGHWAVADSEYLFGEEHLIENLPPAVSIPGSVAPLTSGSIPSPTIVPNSSSLSPSPSGSFSIDSLGRRIRQARSSSSSIVSPLTHIQQLQAPPPARRLRSFTSYSTDIEGPWQNASHLHPHGYHHVHFQQVHLQQQHASSDAYNFPAALSQASSHHQQPPPHLNYGPSPSTSPTVSVLSAGATSVFTKESSPQPLIKSEETANGGALPMLNTFFGFFKTPGSSTSGGADMSKRKSLPSSLSQSIREQQQSAQLSSASSASTLLPPGAFSLPYYQPDFHDGLSSSQRHQSNHYHYAGHHNFPNQHHHHLYHDSVQLLPGETPRDRIRALEADVSVLVAKLEAMHAKNLIMEAQLEGRTIVDPATDTVFAGTEHLNIVTGDSAAFNSLGRVLNSASVSAEPPAVGLDGAVKTVKRVESSPSLPTAPNTVSDASVNRGSPARNRGWLGIGSWFGVAPSPSNM